METATAGELNFSQQQVLTPRRGAGDYAPTDMLTPDTIDKIVAAFARPRWYGSFYHSRRHPSAAARARTARFIPTSQGPT